MNEASIGHFGAKRAKREGRPAIAVGAQKLEGPGRREGTSGDRTNPRAGQGPSGEKEQKVTPVPLWKPQLAWGREGGRRGELQSKRFRDSTIGR